MKRLSVGLVLLVALFFVADSQLGGGEPATKSQEFMRGKLMHSQKVLEAIALEDYSGLSQHAEQIRLLSLDENWQVMQTQQYAKLSAEFRTAASALSDAGKDKNLDGAILAYFRMTQNCVNCHRYVRKTE